jgi:hypothetical protein
MTSAAIMAGAVAGCSAGGGHGNSVKPAQPAFTSPVPTPLALIADYRDAVSIAVADHLRVWIEADLETRWEEGPKWFNAAVDRVAALANRPGVAGIKIADELGYYDGMDSAAKIRKFLADSATALHAKAPGKLILVDMLVPQLGCVPGHQSSGSAAARCSEYELHKFPQLSLQNVDSYLRMRVINVLDLSTDLQSASTYASWRTTADAAQSDAWREVNRLGWPSLVHLQGRKALAEPGSFTWTQSEAAAVLHEFVDIPLRGGAHAVDIWTWHQEYDGQMYQLMDPGMRTNALWSQLEKLRSQGVVLFTHMSPHSVQSGVRADLAKISTVFTDVFLPAGTG